MKKVYQTDTTRETGNCLQACVASLLNMDMQTVPDFKYQNPHAPIFPMQKWLEGRGYSVVQTHKLYDGTKDTLCIVAVASKSSVYDGGTHAVVGRIDKTGHIRLLHDPNPKNKQEGRGKRIKSYLMLYFIFMGSKRVKRTKVRDYIDVD